MCFWWNEFACVNVSYGASCFSVGAIWLKSECAKSPMLYILCAVSLLYIVCQIPATLPNVQMCQRFILCAVYYVLCNMPYRYTATLLNVQICQSGGKFPARLESSHQSMTSLSRDKSDCFCNSLQFSLVWIKSTTCPVSCWNICNHLSWVMYPYTGERRDWVVHPWRLRDFPRPERCPEGNLEGREKSRDRRECATQ